MLLLARTTPIDEVKKKSEGLSVFLVDIKASLGHGLDIKPLRAMINHNTTEVFIDGLRVPVENLIGEEGKGFRYILDGMNAERILIASEAIGDGRWFIEKASKYASERIVFDRPIGHNQGVQFPIARAYAEHRGGRADGAQGRGVVRGRPAVRAGGQHGQAAQLGSVMAGRRGCAADPRRLRLRRGIRHRAQVARDAAVPGRADLDQPRSSPISPSTCSACRAPTEATADRTLRSAARGS